MIHCEADAEVATIEQVRLLHAGSLEHVPYGSWEAVPAALSEAVVKHGLTPHPIR